MHTLRSKAHIEKKRKKRRKFFRIIPAACVVAISFCGYYVFAERFHVTAVHVEGASFAQKEDVERTVHEALSKKLWGIIPRTSSLLINKEALRAQLYSAYPSFKEIEIDIAGSDLRIMAKERVATSIICNDSICLFVDEEGRAFALAPRFEGSSFLKLETYNMSIMPGDQVIDKNELDEVIGMVKVFESLQAPVQYVSFDSEANVTFVGPNDTRFIISRHDDMNAVEERLGTLFDSRPDVASGIYEYIDLRIESKIFLKNRES